jgi:hypothetical protein
MFYMEGHCGFCRHGDVGFQRCSDGLTIVLMCDECDAVWLDPAHRETAQALIPSMATSELPGTPYAVAGGAAGWATLAEIEKAGWQAYVYGEQRESVRRW